MKKILPFTIPLLSHSPNDTYIMSILETSSEYNEWIMNNFLNIKINTKTYSDNFCPRQMFDACPFFEKRVISYSSIIGNYPSFVKFCIDYIDKGYYIYMILNMKYIEWYHTNFDDDHNILIYGYDNNKSELCVADFFCNGIYSTARISYDLAEKAFVHLQDVPEFGESDSYLNMEMTFDLFLLTEPILKQFDYRLCIYTGATDFLNSVRPNIDIGISQIDDIEAVSCIYGLHCFDFLIENCYEFMVETNMGLRPLKLLNDFNLLWLKRLSFIVAQGLIIENFELSQLISDIYKHSKLALLIYLKNTAQNTKDKVFCEKIRMLLSVSKDMTSRFLVNIAEGLK